MTDLGAALSGVFAVPGGQAQLFTGGLSLHGPAGTVTAEFGFPMIARPWIATGSGPSLPATSVAFETGDWGDVETAVKAALTDRVSLVPTGVHGREAVPRVGVPLDAGPAWLPRAPISATPGSVDLLRPERSTGVGGLVIPALFGLSFNASLAERTLYDVHVKDDAGVAHLVAPHATYHRQDWTDFGLIHVTDLHVARRIDDFRPTLTRIGRPEAAAKVNNWNDRFRGFIRYANFLHDSGALDVIVATGDNYDYLFEFDDDDNGQGNAEFLRNLLLGKAPGPDFPDVEELRVPIFMVPGNHDYRLHPYFLVFDVKVGPFTHRFHNFPDYNMLEADALALWTALFGGVEDGVPTLDSDSAARQVAIDPEVRPFHESLADKGSYVVELGKHRIAMIDSAHDVGVVDSPWEAIAEYLGFASEDKKTFVGGSPNCEGVLDGEFAMVTDALGATPADGLFLVGVHAPLFNNWDAAYPYFLRETQRPAAPFQAYGYLTRNSLIRLTGSFEESVESAHPTWFAGDHDNRAAPAFVKRIGNADLLDYGVSRGRADELIGVLAGMTGLRPADLVLGGHTHRHNEFVVRPMVTGELAFYLDFYTANPRHYYPTRYVTDISYSPTAGNPTADNYYIAKSDVTYVEVDPDAMPDATPWPMPWDARYDNVVQIPPYPNPLVDAVDKSAWWNEHRPLMVQTAALGPMENNQVSFSGFRLVTVRSDVIQNIDFISSERLELNQFRMPLADAVRIDPLGQWRHFERSRRFTTAKAEGRPTSVVVPQLSVDDVIFRAEDGHLWEVWRQPTDAGRTDLTANAGAPAAASDPSAYVAVNESLVVVLYRGTDDQIHSLYWWTGAVGHDPLTGSIGAPKAAGIPCGYYDAGESRNYVFYRGTDGRLHSLYWVGAEGVSHENWSDLSPDAPRAAGDPVAYFDTVRRTSIVVYRAANGSIHSMYAGSGAVGHDSLSASAATPPAAGDPVAFYLPNFDMHQVIYRGVDGHIYEIVWQGVAPATGRSLTAEANAPLAVGEPAAFYSLGTNTKRVIFRSADDNLNELWWAPGGLPATHLDLSIYSSAAPAAGDPTAYCIEGVNTQHAAYRGKDGYIHEIRWI
jgi:hypothetical protein